MYFMGEQSMNVLMLLKNKSEVAFVYDTNTLRQGIEKMHAHGYSAIPVLSKDGTYVGSVSEGDFLWAYLRIPQQRLTGTGKLSGQRHSAQGL